MYKKAVFATLSIIVLLLVGKLVLSNASLFPFLFQLLFNRDIKLKQVDSRVNILLLGIGGGSHEGPNQTDTIIFASLDPVKDKINLVSIPRDLWVPELGGKDKKINSAYASGESLRKGGGIVLAQAVVSKVIDQPIDYTIRVDFQGFVKAVDLVGGLDVTVDKTFDDYEYPISGKEDDACGHTEEELQALATESSQLEAFPCRYKHIHFDKGVNHMNGETALEFVRSRHGTNGEGSDFARSNRQEKIIKGFKDKVLSLQILANPAKVFSLYNVLKNSIDTNIKTDEFDDFIRLAQKMRGAKIQSAVLDMGDESQNRAGLLINPDISEEYNYEWVLTPRMGNGNFSEVKLYVECQLTTGNCPVASLTKN